MDKLKINENSTKDELRKRSLEFENEEIKFKRPRLKDDGFEYPHIIYVKAEDLVYHPPIFQALSLGRRAYQERHPRSKRKMEINNNELEAEEAYKRLMYRRFEIEIEMVKSIIKNPKGFSDLIPSSTCTLVLNIDSKFNKKLYKKCLQNKNEKAKILEKYNLCEYSGEIKTKISSKLDNKSPYEMYLSLKHNFEKAIGIEERDFPVKYYTADQPRIFYEEGGIYKKMKILMNIH